MKKILYFGYYLKQLDRPKFRLFLDKVSKETGRSKIGILIDVLYSVFRYNISPLEYFQFHFYRITAAERSGFAGTGYMYEYQLQMNPKGGRAVLEDKILFLDVYKKFIRHRYASLGSLKNSPQEAGKLLAESAGKLVFKHSHGQCGRGIEVLSSEGLTAEKIIARLETTGNDYVEEFVEQHPDIMKMSPSGLNTIRVVTQVTNSRTVDIVAARFRITVNSAVDNLAAGNIAAPINIMTGVVEGPGVYSDITKPDEYNHPVTNTPIVGFQIPFWKETMDMIVAAALLRPENRSIGWDVAITQQGPELIEGNHDWCKLLWQLPAHRGLKQDIEKYK